VAIRLAPDEAAKAVRLVIHTMGQNDPYDLSGLLYLLKNQPDPTDASRAARLIIAAFDQEKDANARWCLAVGLALVARRMETGEAARICGPALPHLVAALVQKGDVAESAGEENGSNWAGLVDGLKAASSLDPIRASHAARILADALTRPGTKVVRRRSLSEALATVAVHLPPVEAAKAARALVTAWSREPDYGVSQSLAKSLPSIANQIDPAKAVTVGRQAAHEASDALEGQEPTGALSSLGEVLGAMVGRMEPAEAKRFCGESIRSASSKQSCLYNFIVKPCSQIDPVTAKAVAWELARQVCSDNDPDSNQLNEILTDVGRVRPTLQPSDGTTEGRKPPTKALPCRLTAQELVELLKMPTCFAHARRVVLDHLGNVYGRRFTNDWDFVRFAREKGLDVDLTTPPRRPNRGDSIKRMLDILDGQQ